MKLTKKVTSIVLSLALFLSLFLSAGQVSEAAVSVSTLKKAVPSKVRIMPYNEYLSGDYTSTTSIFVPYATSKNCISNIKVSQKGLYAKMTNEQKYDDSSDTYPYYGVIGLYANKEGTYKVSFDVLKKKGGAKLYSKTVTVYVKSDSPFAYAKFAGKSNWSSVQKKNKGKISFKMNKGYKLKSIEVGTYQRSEEKDNYSSEYSTSSTTKVSSTLVYKKVKNNSVITLGTNGDYYSYNYSYKSDYSTSLSHNMYDDMLATTIVKVTYVDKYTKKNADAYYYLYKIAK